MGCVLARVLCDRAGLSRCLALSLSHLALAVVPDGGERFVTRFGLDDLGPPHRHPDVRV